MRNTLKRTMAMLLALIMILALGACGGKTKTNETNPPAADNTETKTPNTPATQGGG